VEPEKGPGPRKTWAICEQVHNQIVAVRNTLYWSDKWKTFPDFLADYIKQKIGSDWGNTEIGKPFAERHPLLQWYDALCHYQRETIRTPGEVSNGNVSGLVACYLGLAYSLSDAEFTDYMAHREVYFGKILHVSKGIKDRYELFEWFIGNQKGLPRATLLERLSAAPKFADLTQLSDGDLLAEYCEMLVAAAPEP
jgi:hypothetical protein